MLPLIVPNFIATNGTFLTAFNAAFYNVLGAMYIQNNGALGSDGDSHIAGVNDGSFLADHYAEAVISSLTAGSVGYVGVAVRCGAAASGNGYAYLTTCTGGNAFLLRYDVGSFTVLGTGAVLSPGDTIRLEAVGNVLTPKVNGVIADIGAVTDNTYATGVGGAAGFRSDVLDLLGSFKTGNMGAAPSPLRYNSILNGLGSSGPFFNNSLG